MILPPQKLSSAQKEARDSHSGKNNYEETIDYYISQCHWNKQTDEILSLYRYVGGFIDERDYKTAKVSTNKQKDDNVPSTFNAELKNHNILKGIVNLLMGEFGRRAHEYVLTSINPLDEMSYQDGLNVIIRDYYSQHVANELMELGLDLGQKVQEMQPLDAYIEKYKRTFDEERVISGQDILDYIVYACELDNKYLDLYYDWIITGRFFSYKKVNHDNVYFEPVPPHEICVPVENHSRYIEDASWVVRRQILPVYKVVDLFKGRLDTEVIDALENVTNNVLGTSFSSVKLTGRDGFIHLPTLNIRGSAGLNTESFQSSAMNDGVELYHVAYKTWRKFGILLYLDEFGQEQKLEVGDDYKLNKEQGDISIEWDWDSEIIEGYRYDNYYLDVKPLLENRADLDVESLQKMPYNGIIERNADGEVQSIIKDGLPYQRRINLIQYQVEKMINKNKDKLIVMPYGLVPRKLGMNTAKQMHHADTTSILWVDETAPNAAFAAQMIKVLDMSLGSFIKDSIALIQETKSEYWETIGMNAQRYADVGSSAGKAVTEQAIVRSAIITYELTRQFDSVIERDYKGLIDISKLAYINGKKAKYVRSDGSIAMLNMNQDGANYHSSTSYNLKVKDASVMSEAIQAIRGQIQAVLQNGGDLSIMGEVWSTNNVTKLTALLKKATIAKQEREDAQLKAQQDSNERIEQMKAETAKIDQELTRYKIDKEFEAAIYAADKRSESSQIASTSPRPANEVELKLADHKLQKDARELEIKQQVANTQAIQKKRES